MHGFQRAYNCNFRRKYQLQCNDGDVVRLVAKLRPNVGRKKLETEEFVRRRNSRQIMPLAPQPTDFPMTIFTVYHIVAEKRKSVHQCACYSRNTELLVAGVAFEGHIVCTRAQRPQNIMCITVLHRDHGWLTLLSAFRQRTAGAKVGEFHCGVKYTAKVVKLTTAQFGRAMR